ncbi:MAG: alpha/beta hydrolase [Alphaproteobacteria bacterium]
MDVSHHINTQSEKIAYIHIPAGKTGKEVPAVMFLGGFKSDMEGTKAIYLQEQCQKRGQEFLRFDYTGHGISDGAFIDGTIGKWAQDAIDIFDNIVSRDVILVGSSMGGWISLLLLLKRSQHIKGVIGIAAAPDFTTDIENKMTDDQRQMVIEKDRLEVPNDYSDEPYIFTRALLEDGKAQSLLTKTHDINAPLTLIQGKKDADVAWEKALKIKECFQGPETEIIFIEDGDHRLSRPEDLKKIDEHVSILSKQST